MAIIAYLRVSTDEQAQNGFGMEAQLDAIQKAQGTPDAVFSDEGHSGADPKRPGLLDALEILSEGDTLAVAKRDRLARDMYLSCWIEKEVKKRGAFIASAAGEGNGEDLQDLILRRVADMFAEIERHTINARMEAGRQQARKRGIHLSRFIPLGYELDEDGKHLKVNPAEQQVLELIHQLREAGQTLRQIGTELEKRGILTKKGRKKWHPR